MGTELLHRISGIVSSGRTLDEMHTELVGLAADVTNALARLEEENARLKRELETRKLVERAKGILQRDRQLTEEDAYLHLRNESRRQRRPMRELAEAIIRAEA